MKFLLGIPSILASCAAVLTSPETCSKIVDGYKYNLDSLKGHRFEVPARDGETLIFGICNEVDHSGGVAYIKQKDGSTKLIGSLDTAHDWKPLKETDEEDGGFRYVGAQLTYFAKDSDIAKSDQWVFKQRFLCTLDSGTALLKGFKVDYPSRTATVDISSVKACPAKYFAPSSFFEKHALTLLLVGVTASLIIGFSSGASLQTFAFISVAVLIGLLAFEGGIYALFGDGLPLTGPGGHSVSAVILRGGVALVLGTAVALGAGFVGSLIPSAAMFLVGFIAVGGAMAMFNGVFHYLWRLFLSKQGAAVLETIMFAIASLGGAFFAAVAEGTGVPLLASGLGAYGLTWVIGQYRGDLPRQALVGGYLQELLGLTNFVSRDGKVPWYPIRGRQSLPGALLYFALFAGAFWLFFGGHVAAYGGYKPAYNLAARPHEDIVHDLEGRYHELSDAQHRLLGPPHHERDAIRDFTHRHFHTRHPHVKTYEHFASRPWTYQTAMQRFGAFLAAGFNGVRDFFNLGNLEQGPLLTLPPSGQPSPMLPENMDLLKKSVPPAGRASASTSTTDYVPPNRRELI